MADGGRGGIRRRLPLTVPRGLTNQDNQGPSAGPTL